MNVWKQLDEMKSKHDTDRRNVDAAAKSYGFVYVKAHSHGEWTCRSNKNAKHCVELRATSADDLVKQMQAEFTKTQAGGVKMS